MCERRFHRPLRSLVGCVSRIRKKRKKKRNLRAVASFSSSQSHGMYSLWKKKKEKKKAEEKSVRGCFILVFIITWNLFLKKGGKRGKEMWKRMRHPALHNVRKMNIYIYTCVHTSGYQGVFGNHVLQSARQINRVKRCKPTVVAPFLHWFPQ